MSHIGTIVVAVVGLPVFLAIVLSLGRSIRRVGRMNPGSPDYLPMEPGAEPKHHGGLLPGGHTGGGHNHHQGHHGGHMGGGHAGGGGHVGGGHHG
ncbi:MAG TPA: hypothetical protein VF979_07520 [Streptosporangiaceae bacterium]